MREVAEIVGMLAGGDLDQGVAFSEFVNVAQRVRGQGASKARPSRNHKPSHGLKMVWIRSHRLEIATLSYLLESSAYLYIHFVLYRSVRGIKMPIGLTALCRFTRCRSWMQ